jgi:hypothetical protein
MRSPRARRSTIWHGRQIPASKSERDNRAVRDERRNVVSRFLAARVLRTKHGRLAEFSARRYPWLDQFPSFKASFEVSVRSRPA